MQHCASQFATLVPFVMVRQSEWMVVCGMSIVGIDYLYVLSFLRVHNFFTNRQTSNVQHKQLVVKGQIMSFKKVHSNHCLNYTKQSKG